MAAEAEKLINISLTKIAKSRAQRGGVSLHRNLLVATVLQRARFVFMEEAYHMVQRHGVDSDEAGDMCDERELEVYYSSGITPDDPDQSTNEVAVGEACDSPEKERLISLPEDADKENHSSAAPENSPAQEELKLRLREEVPILKEKSENNHCAVSHSVSTCESFSSAEPSPASMKRRRAVPSEWETEEAVLSILPKKVKRDDVFDESYNSVLLNEVIPGLPESQSSEDSEESEVTSMEIDRITSLVSIFSFGGLSSGGSADIFSGNVVIGNSSEGISKLTRSVSTPDLCSAQAKEGGCVDVMQRPLMAMTV